MNKWIICSDFDGTICLPDSSDYLLSQFAPPEWNELDKAVWAGRITERECYARQIAMLRVTWPEARAALLKGVKIRDGFQEFVEWTRRRNVPLVILSSGLRVLIDELLAHAGISHLQVEAHGIRIAGDRWTLVPHPGARLEEHCSHCKCAHLAAYQERGLRVIYIGDSFTDLCPSRRADMLFATFRLAEACQRQNVPFFSFETFQDVKRTLDAVLTTTIQEPKQ
jgi:2,3-diketo-5-methylthio-1-phosphopentane phosphatase